MQKLSAIFMILMMLAGLAVMIIILSQGGL